MALLRTTLGPRLRGDDGITLFNCRINKLSTLHKLRFFKLFLSEPPRTLRLCGKRLPASLHQFRA